MANFIEKVEKIKMVYRLLILAGLFGAFLAGFIFGIYLPKTKEIKKIEARIETLDKKIREAKLREKNLAKFEAEQTKIKAQFQEALALLPDEKEIPDLLRNVTRLGVQSGLEFLVFKPQREREMGFYIEIPVTIQVNGQYHDVAVFFDKVGHMDRIVNISRLTMRPGSALSTILSTQCVATTFRFKESN